MQSLIIAFAMYSKIPMPRADWNDKNMRYAFCWFPVIGLVIGLVELAVFYILTKWQAGSVFRGVCLMAVPLLVTGGIHLDGFMDTTDARSSYGDREKKLAILKDSHVGAFAVIGCSFYLILSAGAWSEIDAKGIVVMANGFCSGTGIQRISGGKLQRRTQRRNADRFQRTGQEKDSYCGVGGGGCYFSNCDVLSLASGGTVMQSGSRFDICLLL